MNVSERTIQKLVSWASNEDFVIAMYLFGSRVKGTNTPQSDLDVAVTLHPEPGDENLLATWICESPRLKSELQQLNTIERTDLQWYNPGETEIVASAIIEHGVLIYKREKTGTES